MSRIATKKKSKITTEKALLKWLRSKVIDIDPNPPWGLGVSRSFQERALTIVDCFIDREEMEFISGDLEEIGRILTPVLKDVAAGLPSESLDAQFARFIAGMFCSIFFSVAEGSEISNDICILWLAELLRFPIESFRVVKEGKKEFLVGSLEFERIYGKHVRIPL